MLVLKYLTNHSHISITKARLFLAKKYQTMTLAFSKDQIRVILQQFVVFLQSEECSTGLKKLAPNEEKMADFIETNQKRIFISNGVDPNKGMDDLGKIATVWKSDKDIVQLLMMVAGKEEFAVQVRYLTLSCNCEDAMSSNLSPEQIKAQKQALDVKFAEIQKQLQAVKTDPKGLLQIQMVIQQYLLQLPPQERSVSLHQF